MEATIPAAIAGALKEVDGFAGCLVMISHHEARLVTVVTFWAGNDRPKCCSQNVRWVHALLAPYLDRRLRVQTFSMRVPIKKGDAHLDFNCWAKCDQVTTLEKSLLKYPPIGVLSAERLARIEG